MKIADTSMALRFGATRSRTSADAPDESFGYGDALPQPDASSIDSSRSSSRNLARMLSEKQLGGNEPSETERAKACGRAAEEEFGKWAKMSAPEKIRAVILEQHGLTEAGFESLPKEIRDEIEKEIQDAIKHQYGLDEKQGSGGSEANTSPDVARA